MYMFACALVCACAHVCTCMWRPKIKVLVSFGYSLPYSFEEKFLVNPELTIELPGEFRLPPPRTGNLDMLSQSAFSMDAGTKLRCACFNSKPLLTPISLAPWLSLYMLIFSMCISLAKGIKTFPYLMSWVFILVFKTLEPMIYSELCFALFPNSSLFSEFVLSWFESTMLLPQPSYPALFFFFIFYIFKLFFLPFLPLFP